MLREITNNPMLAVTLIVLGLIIIAGTLYYFFVIKAERKAMKRREDHDRISLSEYDWNNFKNNN